MMREKNFDIILDECVDRLNRGERIEACLTDHPQHAAELEPLLKAMVGAKAAYSFTPLEGAKRAAKKRFYAALEKRRHPSFWQNFFGHRFALTAAAVVIVAVAGFLALRTSVLEKPIPIIAVSAPNPEGNFAFLVSDEINAISDFTGLNVTIEKVGLLQSGNPSQWVEFTPEIKEFDLTLLPGDITQQLWRGNVPEGHYSQVIIYVSGVRGTLNATGETIDIKLPSNKLQMSIPFQVETGNITSFTYDLTVVKTGRDRNIKYLLKPQIAESGASHQPVPATPPAQAHTPVQAPTLPDKARGNPQT